MQRTLRTILKVEAGCELLINGRLDMEGSSSMRSDMAETVHDCVRVPEDAGSVLRRRLGLKEHETPRIAFVAGPGDAVGTFNHWIKGNFDPRVPVIAYSTMFYTLIDKLGAQALLLSESDIQLSHEEPRFRFVHTPRSRPNGRIAYFSESFAFSLRVARAIRAFSRMSFFWEPTPPTSCWPLLLAPHGSF